MDLIVEERLQTTISFTPSVFLKARNPSKPTLPMKVTWHKSRTTFSAFSLVTVSISASLTACDVSGVRMWGSVMVTTKMPAVLLDFNTDL